jgi:NADH dehydrogenase FAD-containing subunit
VVEDIDPDSKQVPLADGARLTYDALIVATGSETSYFGHDSWQEWAPSGVWLTLFMTLNALSRALLQCGQRGAALQNDRGLQRFVITRSCLPESPEIR